jgi:hypothetical protein
VNNQKTKIKKGVKMKKLIAIISIVTALATVLVMALPVSAASFGATATVGAGGSAPYMIAVFSTPNEDSSTTSPNGPGVKPEFVLPNSSGTFSNLNAASDGWKMIKFYVIAADSSSTFQGNINGINVTVNYPAAASTATVGQTGYYVPGAEKFQLDASKDGNGAWTASQVYPTTEYYPSEPFMSSVNGVQATPPAWTVRVLTPSVGATPAADIVDVNADGTPNPTAVPSSDDGDGHLSDILTSWGSMVSYGQNPYTMVQYNASSAGAQFNANKALCLELTGWIWFHQPAVTYSYTSKAVTTTWSSALTNYFHFIGYTSLYTDFSTVTWNNLPSSGINLSIPGDTDLSTPTQPTVWDNGNLDATLSVSATGLYLNGDSTYGKNGIHADPTKRIDQFDATLTYKGPTMSDLIVGNVIFNDGDPARLITVGANTTDGTPVLLKACNPAQIDFSLHGLASYNNPGVYSGTLTLTIGTYTPPSPY